MTVTDGRGEVGQSGWTLTGRFGAAICGRCTGDGDEGGNGRGLNGWTSEMDWGDGSGDCGGVMRALFWVLMMRTLGGCVAG